MTKVTNLAKQPDVKKSTPSLFNPARFEEMEKLFSDFFNNRWLSPWRTDWPASMEAAWSTMGRVPSVDIVDRDDTIVVKAELPGVDRKNLEVTTTDDSVTIKGSTEQEKKDEKEDYYRYEISRGEFSRTIALPAVVDNSKAKAIFKDGILELTLPKTEVRTRRTIPVE